MTPAQQNGDVDTGNPHDSEPANQLPDPPLIVLATNGRNKTPRWFYMVNPTYGAKFAAFDCYGWHDASKLTVVEHPRNDPECVAVIEQSREAPAAKRSNRGRLKNANKC